MVWTLLLERIRPAPGCRGLSGRFSLQGRARLGLLQMGMAGTPAPNCGPAWQSPDNEKAFLMDQSRALKAELAALEKQLTELEGSQDNKN